MAHFNFEAVKDLLCCPKTRAALVSCGDALVSCDPETRLRYPITDGFPVLLIDEATKLTKAEWSDLMTRNGRDPVTGGVAVDASLKG